MASHSEVLHMLDFSVNTQIDFLTWIRRGALDVKEINAEDISRIIDLSKKYSDVPMDFGSRLVKWCKFLSPMNA